MVVLLLMAVSPSSVLTKDDSYALVALNGGATFTDCPAGTYTDVVTGKTYTGSTIDR